MELQTVLFLSFANKSSKNLVDTKATYKTKSWYCVNTVTKISVAHIDVKPKKETVQKIKIFFKTTDPLFFFTLKSSPDTETSIPSATTTSVHGLSAKACERGGKAMEEIGATSLYIFEF